MNLHTVQLPSTPSAPYSPTPSARSLMTTTCEACAVIKIERRCTLSRERDGIADTILFLKVFGTQNDFLKYFYTQIQSVVLYLVA